MSDDGEKRRQIIDKVVSVIFVLLSHVVGFTPRMMSYVVGRYTGWVGSPAPTPCSQVDELMGSRFPPVSVCEGMVKLQRGRISRRRRPRGPGFKKTLV